MTPPALDLLCLQTGKRKYVTQAGALAAASAMQCSTSEGYLEASLLQAYNCPYCHEWHIGHARRRYYWDGEQ